MAAALALVLLLILAAPAGAANVTAGADRECPYKSGCYEYTALKVTASAGEANDLQHTHDGREHTFRDAGAPLMAGAGCRNVDASTVTCSVAHEGFKLEIETGDGDDRVDAPGAYGIRGGDGNDVLHGQYVFGEAGNDTLSGRGPHDGGEGDDRIVGGGTAGPGDDVIDASAGSLGYSSLGPGVDVYLGSPGFDGVHDNGPERDRIDGGAGGEDVMSYGSAPFAVTVDLGAASQAPAHDDLTGFERIIGTGFDDSLTGDDGPNEIDAGPGNDTLVGRGGDDTLRGESGDDRLDAGPGNDLGAPGGGLDDVVLGEGDDRTLSSADYLADRIDCGPGDDDGEADSGDLHTDCERLALRAPERLLSMLVKAGRGRHRMLYDSCEHWPSCTGTSRLRARVRGRAVALPDVRFAQRRAGDAPRSNSFRLPAAAARELRRTGRLRIDVTTIVDPGPQAGVLPGEHRVILRRPRSGRNR